MEFPSDFMDEQDEILQKRNAVNNRPTQPPFNRSPTSPVAPVTKYSTAPSIPAISNSNRSNTFAHASPALRSPTAPTAPAKTTKAPARSATVNDKKSKRLTRTLSRMFGGKAPRAAHEPLPAIKTDLKVPADSPALKSPKSPKSPKAPTEADDAKRKDEAVAAAAAALEGTPEPQEDAKSTTTPEAKTEEEHLKKPSLEKVPSRSTAGAAETSEVAAPESPVDATKPDNLGELQPTGSKTSFGEPQNVADYEKRTLPPIQTTTLPADIAKLQSLSSPLSPESATKLSHEGDIVDEKSAAANTQEKKKKGNTGFFSIFRMRRKNKITPVAAPQVAAV